MSELLLCSFKAKNKTMNKRAAVTHVSKLNNNTTVIHGGDENNCMITEKDVVQLNGTIAEYDSSNDYVEN